MVYSTDLHTSTLLSPQEGHGPEDQPEPGPSALFHRLWFLSNPRNNGMCSVCYKDFLQRQNSNGCVSPPGGSSCTCVCINQSHYLNLNILKQVGKFLIKHYVKYESSSHITDINSQPQRAVKQPFTLRLSCR